VAQQGKTHMAKLARLYAKSPLAIGQLTATWNGKSGKNHREYFIDVGRYRLKIKEDELLTLVERLNSAHRSSLHYEEYVKVQEAKERTWR
jgi:hypothetical protein